MKEPKRLLERDIQKQITKYLDIKGVPYAVTNAERVWNPQGFVRRSKVSPDHPDLSATLTVFVDNIRVGLSFYIEVKTETGTLRDGQRIKLMELANAGALCIIARCLDDVRDIVERFKDTELNEYSFSQTRELLKLKMSDRRSKDVRDALSSFSFEKDVGLK